jgi:D-arabinose 1-dehydrogenase-like Zn-dependent alcohol dehydrogenase
MDSPTTGTSVRILTTDGKGSFYESTYDLPELQEGDILVKAAMTGVCRSDIAMMQGDFQLLPASMHGHEGLGVNVATGEYVATRGEPAYADYYVARKGTYVTVPELDPKYIIEPVACAINVVLNSLDDLTKRQGGKLCILGTGFLARIVNETLKIMDLKFSVIDVVGSSNVDYWNVLLSKPADHEYDVVIDLSEKDTLQYTNVAENSLIIMAAEKHTEFHTTFGNWLWKNVTMHCPSPRATTFIQAMRLAVTYTETGKLSIDNTWTRSYNRNTEWQQAFNDAVNRPYGYSRGYIDWTSIE